MLHKDFQNKMDEAYESINCDCEHALSIFNSLLKMEPDNVDLLNGKGSVLIKLDRFDEAEECFNKSVLIDENSSALINKGIISKNKGEFQSALKFYDRAVQLNPSLNGIVLNFKRDIIELIDDSILNYNNFSIKSNAYIKKGILYRDEFNFCDALDCFNLAVKEDLSCKHNVMALIEEVKTLFFSEFLFKTPDFTNEDISNLKFDFYSALLVEENPKKALTIMDIVLGIDGTDLDTLNFKGCILFLFHEFSDAIDCFDKCLEIDDEYYYALFNKGLVLRLIHEYKKSLSCFDALIKEKKYVEKAEFYRANILEKMK